MSNHAYIDGQREPSLEKLSPAMWEMLFEADELGSVPFNARRLSTRRVLVCAEMLTSEAPTTLTDKGRRALMVEWMNPKTGDVHHCP